MSSELLLVRSQLCVQIKFQKMESMVSRNCHLKTVILDSRSKSPNSNSNGFGLPVVTQNVMGWMRMSAPPWSNRRYASEVVHLIYQFGVTSSGIRICYVDIFHVEDSLSAVIFWLLQIGTHRILFCQCLISQYAGSQDHFHLTDMFCCIFLSVF